MPDKNIATTSEPLKDCCKLAIKQNADRIAEEKAARSRASDRHIRQAMVIGFAIFVPLILFTSRSEFALAKDAPLIILGLLAWLVIFLELRSRWKTKKELGSQSS